MYYDLNDDVLMRDILSGRYTGTPDGHNIQIQYPFGAFVSSLYDAAPAIDWYGLILIALQFMSLTLICVCFLRSASGKGQRLRVVAELVLMFAATLLSHIFFVQYTFTVGMMAASAILLIMTGKNIINDVAAVLMVGAAFLLRSEMLLLTFPMIIVALFLRYMGNSGEAEDTEGKDKPLKRYVAVLVAMALVIVLGAVGNSIGYRDASWREFYRLFDARTELYDFRQIPPYEGNEALYDSLSLSREEAELLVNYNFSLDENIDAAVMEAVAKEAEIPGDTGFFSRVSGSVKDYLYRLRNFRFMKGYHFPMSDAPWNVLLIALYVVAGIFMFGSERFWWAKLLLIKAVSALLFLYIIFRGRDPVRITHALYLVEMSAVSGAFLPCMGRESGAVRKKLYIATGLVLAALSAFYLPAGVKTLTNELERRQEVNAPYEELYRYFGENPDNEYYIDVYSSVAYSEKISKNAGSGRMNYDICGGWASKSPLYRERLAAAGASTVEDALLADNAYFVIESDADTTWLTDYYAFKGKKIRLEEVKRVGDAFTVYKVSRR